MTGQPEPGAGELAVRTDGDAPAASAPAAAPEPAGPPPVVPPGPPAGRPRRRRTLVVSVLVVVLAGSGAGAYALLAAQSADSGGTPAAKAVTTALVTRTTLVDTEQDDGSLGYDDGLTVDDRFSAETTDAVKAWQADRGLDQTGTVDAQQIVFAGHAVRIGRHQAAVGDQINAGMPVAAISSTHRVATVDLAADVASIAHVNDKVDIELPDGSTVKGTITEVSKVATAAGSGSGSSSSEATITVTIGVDDPRATRELDQAPVKVDFVKQRKRGVLAVPVTALLALAEGGYAVEVSGAGTNTSHLVKVTTGLFAGGQVEVSGAGLRPG